MKNKILPFAAIGIMAALFNIMQVGEFWPDWSIYAANIIFALCNIFAAVVVFKKQSK